MVGDAAGIIIATIITHHIITTVAKLGEAAIPDILGKPAPERMYAQESIASAASATMVTMRLRFAIRSANADTRTALVSYARLPDLKGGGSRTAHSYP